MSKQWRFCVKLVREILGLKFTSNTSKREIARIHSISKTTVGTYIDRAELMGINSIEALNSIDDEKLNQQDVLGLYVSLSGDFKICSSELLNRFGNKKAYSLAQGQ